MQHHNANSRVEERSPSMGSSGGRSPTESEKFLLNLIIFYIPGIKRSFFCDFVIIEYNINID